MTRRLTSPALAALALVALGLVGTAAWSGPGDDTRWADGRVLHVRPLHPGVEGEGAAAPGMTATATLAYDPRRKGAGTRPDGGRGPDPAETPADVAAEGPLPPDPKTISPLPRAPAAPASAPESDGAPEPLDSPEPPPTPSVDAIAPAAPVPPAARVRLDGDTRREGDLAYHEPFNPSVVPLKRGLALNVVAPDLDLLLVPGALTPVPVDPRPAGLDEEPFAATARIDATAGGFIPLPSVSPGDRILSIATTPARDVLLFRDAADNLLLQTTMAGPLDVRWTLAAPRTWFHRTLEAGSRGAEPPARLVPKLPPGLAKEAREVARRIGVGPRDGHAAAILKLVAWFRAFVPGEPPPGRATTYREMALGRLGICRHRSHAFVVTAHGLGIPARYVMNDAHVFVEVWADGAEGAGWLRVDLGGGSEGLDITGGEDKTLHRPPADSLPKPDTFTEEQIAGASRVSGLPSAPAPEPVGDPAAAAAARPPEDDRSEAAAARRDVARKPPDRTAPPSGRWPATTLVAGGGNLPPPGAQLRPASVTLRLAAASPSATRGETLVATGTVRGRDGVAVGPGFVQLLLIPRGGAVSGGAVPWLLGAGPVAVDGVWRVRATLPPAIPLGDWELVAEFPGNATHAPAVGR